MRSIAVICVLSLSCSVPPPSIDAGPVDAGAVDAGTTVDAGPTCVALEVVDVQAADAGRDFLLSGNIGGDFVPRLAWDNLWRVWGGPQPADLPAAMRARYGLVKAPTDNDGLPFGFRQVGMNVRADCLVCHAGEVAGQTVIGAPNTQLDLRLLVDDLETLAAMFGLQQNVPEIRTGARGVTDIMGMTVQLALNQAPGTPNVNTEIGYQDPPAWWAIAAKTKLYTDGDVAQTTHRTFMATQLAFGTSQAQLEALEPRYVELRQYLLSLKPPAWPFAAPDANAVARGRDVFRQSCTGCHRDDRCERQPTLLKDVGTDPERDVQWSQNEVDLVNASWFGALEPLEVTSGYAVPPLVGLWASAPYFHNGSVPTLEAVLDSSKRPAFFSLRTEYDGASVGWKFDALTSAPVNPPRADRARVYDTTKLGLSNEGHRFGDELTADQRADLLQFLKTL
ncbi:MAG: hypothetical protein ACO1OB_22510 [Archangium sp.]